MTAEQAAQLITLITAQTTANENSTIAITAILLFIAGLIFSSAISLIIMGWLRDI